MSKKEKELTPREVSNKNLKPGRPKGAKNKTTLFKEAMRDGFEERLMKDGMKVFDACVQKAIDGDTTAMKILMDRIIPVQEVTQGSGAGSKEVIINISGLSANVDIMEPETVEAEFEELE